jgi:hypothetical protein
MLPRTRITIGLQLALAGMLLRAVLPAGWMPATSLANGTWLEVCDGIVHAPGRQDMNMAGMPRRPAHTHQHRMRPCPFAAAAHLGRTGGLAHLSPATRLSWRQAPQQLRHLVPVAPAFETGSPRGPPALI